MPGMYSPQSRAERLIALGRVALASASLLAIWLDPTQPANYARIAYSLLAAYVVYSAVLAALVWRAKPSPPSRGFVTQVFDLLFFTTFIYFTAGPSSPFIVYFVFSLVCGTVRWGWRGALGTAAASLASFLGLGAYFAYVLSDPTFEFNAFIIYAVYLAVLAVLLGYLGAHEERSKREIAQLADWPRGEPRDLGALAEEQLAHACHVLKWSGAVLAWNDREEPWLYVASMRNGAFELVKLPPGMLEPLVAVDLGTEGFLSPNLGAPEPSVIREAGSPATRRHGAPLHPELVRRFGISGVIAVPLPGETLNGWLFFVNKPSLTLDDLRLGRIVAGIVASRLDLHDLLRRLRESAATEERIRLARDLHDGVMQSLTGIALRLAALQRQFIDEPVRVLPSIEAIRRLIVLGQQDLRFFIDDLKPSASADDGGSPALGARLEELRGRVEQEWNLRVELPRAEVWSAVPDALAREVYLIIREALVNAARHGNAERVAVEANCDGDARLRVQIADDGRGFPFDGTLSLEDLVAKNVGPRSICERVAGLRGGLDLQSRPSGSRLCLDLPIDRVQG